MGVESGQVVYRRNGEEFYRSPVPPSYPLLVDASLANHGATVKDAVLGGVLERVAVAAPALSLPSGAYSEAVSVVVTGEDGAELHYTEDGTEPTQESPSLVSGDSVVVDRSLVLQVKAWAAGLLPSAAVEGRYQIGATATVEPVSWTELVGTQALGSTLAKTASSASWDAGAVSTKGIVSVDGYVEFVGEETGTSRMVGLSRGQTDAGYQDIDYAVYLAGGSLLVYEAGVYRGYFGVWASGDRLRVGVESGQVVYRRNGEEFYRSPVPPSYPLLVDASLANHGATVKDAVLGGVLERVAVAAPALSLPSGAYSEAVSVVVTGEDGAELHYTEDGTEPTQESPSLVSGDSVVVDRSLVLQVKAWAAGLLPSAAVEGRYQIGATATVEPVSWTNVVGAESSPGNLTKTGSSGGWDAGAASTRAIASVNGYVELSSSTSGFQMIGLSEGDSDAGYQDIDYALYLAGGSLLVYESGVYRGSFGSWTSGDRLRVALEDGQVVYRRNGLELYRSLVAPRYPLLVDTSIATSGSGVSNVVLGGVLESTLAATPEFSPPPGRFESSVSVSVTTPTPGATVRYTLDGAEPDPSSPAVTGPILLDGSATLRARAFRGDRFGSPTAVGVYEVGLQTVALPVATPPPGLYAEPVTVSLATTTPGASIRFTTDGSDPTETSALYTGPLGVATATDLAARAFKPGWSPSPVARAAYRFDYGTLAPPVFLPTPGTYVTSVVVTLSGPPGASVHYTTDGSPPTAASPLYEGPLTLTASATVRAASFEPDWSPSVPAEAAYEIKVAAPLFDPPSGRYPSAQDVAIATSTPWATITYTTDGAEPTPSDPTLAPGETVRVDQDATLRARAWKAGATPSDISSATYGIATAQAAVAGGGDHSLALTDGGDVWAWGYNFNGQLGDGTVTPRTTAVRVSQLSGVTGIAAGTSHSLARKKDGSLWAWGNNAHGELGDGSTIQRLTPVRVPGMSAWCRWTAGSSTAWRRRATARCGRGATTATGSWGTARRRRRRHPCRWVSSRGWCWSRPAGRTRWRLRDDGTVWAWGYNEHGELGDGTTTTRLSPVPVAGLSNVVAVAGGQFHSLALKRDGTVWAWGSNGNGQLGDGTLTQRLTPVRVVGLTDVVAIAAGQRHSYALKSDGTVWAWGYNASGQLGDATTTPRSTPMRVGTLPAIGAIGTGDSHGLAIGDDLSAWTWGNNFWGQIGDGTTVNRPTPVKIAEAGFAWRAGTPTFWATARRDGWRQLATRC